VELHVDDAGFVRAPARLVYRRLTDVGSWPTWWRGAAVRALPPSGGDEVWALELTGAPLRRLRLAARLHGWRHSVGFALELWGDLEGNAEFWLEPAHGGTVVHHLLVARTAAPSPFRVHADYRRAIRWGLWGLKDTLQLEARTSAGLTP
jgi:hypothetical protein